MHRLTSDSKNRSSDAVPVKTGLSQFRVVSGGSCDRSVTVTAGRDDARDGEGIPAGRSDREENPAGKT